MELSQEYASFQKIFNRRFYARDVLKHWEQLDNAAQFLKYEISATISSKTKQCEDRKKKTILEKPFISGYHSRRDFNNLSRIFPSCMKKKILDKINKYLENLTPEDNRGHVLWSQELLNFFGDNSLRYAVVELKRQYKKLIEDVSTEKQITIFPNNELHHQLLKMDFLLLKKFIWKKY